MIKIGYRTAKTAIGIVISILLAEWIGLNNAVSAGIITILCIQNTKHRSLQAARTRLIACLVALFYSVLFFEVFSHHAIVIGVIMVLFIPTTVALKSQEGIVSSTVIILHLYAADQMTAGLIINEIGIILIGIGVALLLNSYMPSVERKLVQMQEETERLFGRIFEEIILYLRTNDHSWNGKELTETAELLKQAKTLAFKDVQNHISRYDSLFYQYFTMREKQFDIIERILSIVVSILHRPEQAVMIADFMEELKAHIHPGNTAYLQLTRLDEMKKQFEEMPLPATREEFEARAALYQFVREMEQYLLIKARFRGMKKERLKKHARSFT